MGIQCKWLAGACRRVVELAGRKTTQKAIVSAMHDKLPYEAGQGFRADQPFDV